MWTISQADLATFRATDREECGVMIVLGNRVSIAKVKNVAKRNSDYAILMSDFRKVERTLIGEEKILGFFHTHLVHHSPEPSDQDYEGACLFPEFTNCVYHPATGTLSWYGCLAEETTDVLVAGTSQLARGGQVANPISLPQLAKGQSDASDIALKSLCLSSHI